MCGITGIVKLNNEKISRYSISKMTEALIHRGPDGDGIWSAKNVALGHRRLSIIDLSDAAQQPMLSANERFVLTYNGEIYNFRDIKEKLVKLGYLFTSTSDTEVVLNSLIEWGERAVSMFNGMFALAFLDRATNKLILARDRYGIKPLYYFLGLNEVLFASEQKAILTNENINKKIDVQGLTEYFTFQNIFSNHTLISNIKILEAGHIMEICTVTGEIRNEKYWDFDFRDEVQADHREVSEEVARLFEQAVIRQLVSDVEIGSYLSGGLDSGSIAAITARNVPGLKTFTCGFDLSSASGLELSFDERAKAEAISNFIKSEQYEMVLKSGDMERCLPALVRAIEEPRVGQSYPNFYAAKLASKFVKVVLSGAGGDEIFAGYPWRYFSNTNSENFNDYRDQYYLYWQRLLNRSEISRLFSPIRNEVNQIDTFEIFCSVLDKGNCETKFQNMNINSSLYLEAKTFLHGLLVVEDKISMAHSLETRLPFLDNDLVDFSMSIPSSLKLKNTQSVKSIDENDLKQKFKINNHKTSAGKQILRTAMAKYLPQEVTSRIKQGFSAPDASWFKGESINFIKQNLSTKNAPLYEYIDYKFTQELLDEHFSGRQNKRLLVWSFINLNQYLKENF